MIDHPAPKSSAHPTDLERRSRLPSGALSRCNTHANGENAIGRLIDEEEAEEGAVDWRHYVVICAYMTVAVSVLSVLASIGVQVGNVLSNLWLTEWANDPVRLGEAEANSIGQRSYRLEIYAVLGFWQVRW